MKEKESDSCALSDPVFQEFLQERFYEVRPFEPALFAALGAAIIGVVVLACYLAARRAMRVDPTVALRYE